MERWRVEDDLATDLTDVRRVVVRIVAGEVTITAGQSPRVEVHRESGSAVDVHFHDGILQVSQPDTEMSPLERFFSWFAQGRRHRCTVAITAPPESVVDLTTISAPVVVSGSKSGTKVKTVSGDVILSSLGTKVDVKTISGDVEAKAINAELKLKSVSGDLSVVDGACRRVDAKTVSGEVMLDLDLDPSGIYDISTVSGGVSIRTSAEPNLRVDAKSVSGELVSDFGLDWESWPGRRQLSDTIGTGGARLHVKTVSGDLRVVQGRVAA